MEDELMQPTQEMDLEHLATKILGDFFGELLKKLLNISGGSDANIVSDAYEQMQLFNSSNNDIHLNNAIGLLEQATRNNCWDYTWAKRNVCLIYCYASKERYKDCFTAIMEVIKVKVDTHTLNKKEIHELKILSVSFGFELYQKIIQNLESEKAQLKSEKAQLEKNIAQLKSEKEQLKSIKSESEGTNREGTNRILLIVMCILSSLSIIISVKVVLQT